MVTTTWNFNALNSQTWAVINYMSGKRTKKQIVWEFFWLREEAIYDDNWENVIDFVNDFRDLVALKSKKVRYIPKLWDLWVTEQEFNALFQNWLPTFEVEKPLVSNNEENGKTDWWEQSNSWNTRKTKKK